MQRPHFRPRLEGLEERATPATVTWANPAGGAWDNPANWDLGRTPQPDDDVVVRTLNYGAVIDHAGGSDVVQNISFQVSSGTLAITGGSTLVVTGAIDVPNLRASGGAFTAYNTGSLRANLQADNGGEIFFPALTEYNATVFTRLTVSGQYSLINLPALTTLMATTGGPMVPGEVRLDLTADQGGTINLPALTVVTGHPVDYLIGFTALRASNGGTFAFDPNGSITFAASGSLDVNMGAAVQAGELVVGEGGDLTVNGYLAAASVSTQGSVTVAGNLDLAGGYTAVLGGTTTFQGGAVSVGDLFDNRGSMSGIGAVNGNVRNAGSFRVLTFVVNGDFTQTADGQLSLQLRSAADYDQLVVTGLASLDGTLDVQFARGFQPTPGDEFTVLFFGAGRGTFARQTGSSASFTFVYVFGGGFTLPPGLTLVAN